MIQASSSSLSYSLPWSSRAKAVKLIECTRPLKRKQSPDNWVKKSVPERSSKLAFNQCRSRLQMKKTKKQTLRLIVRCQFRLARSAFSLNWVGKCVSKRPIILRFTLAYGRVIIQIFPTISALLSYQLRKTGWVGLWTRRKRTKKGGNELSVMNLLFSHYNIILLSWAFFLAAEQLYG